MGVSLGLSLEHQTRSSNMVPRGWRFPSFCCREARVSRAWFAPTFLQRWFILERPGKVVFFYARGPAPFFDKGLTMFIYVWNWWSVHFHFEAPHFVCFQMYKRLKILIDVCENVQFSCDCDVADTAPNLIFFYNFPNRRTAVRETVVSWNRRFSSLRVWSRYSCNLLLMNRTDFFLLFNQKE